jgi:penicillin-binding protein 2
MDPYQPLGSNLRPERSRSRSRDGGEPRRPGAGRTELPGAVHLRLTVLRVALVLVFAVLLGQLWRLQMAEGQYYREAADLNRFRLDATAGPRGVIYDRWGHLLVRNTPQITVSIIPAYLPDDPNARVALLMALSKLLDVPMESYVPCGPGSCAGSEPDVQDGTLPGPAAAGAARAEGAKGATPGPKAAARAAAAADDGKGKPQKAILDILREAELAPYRPVAVKEGVARDIALRLEEEHLDWPGVLVEIDPQREYLYGSLVAHLLGYVGPIPGESADAYIARGYDPNTDDVGLSGIEYSFEDALRGRDGQKLIEVDVAGREVRTVGKSRPAIPGNNLRLTLDLDLQQKAEEILKQHLNEKGKTQGIVVALNPQTGEVLALISYPSYDNNVFMGGISPKNLAALQKNPAKPLLDQAISGQFPPGSTFKMVTASAGLEERVISAHSTLYCGGIMWLPNRFYPEDPSLAQPFYCFINTYGGRHGAISVVPAIGKSCDIFFYQVGGGYRKSVQGLGEDRLGYYAELFGLGEPTGIDLPGEAGGLVPTAKWKRLSYAESWTTGDTYNMAIGQGFVLATPLQMVNAAAAIANGGFLYRPQVVHDVVDGDGNVVQAFAPDLIRQLPLSPETIKLVQQGMRAATAPSGTAYGAALPGISVAGKTGTAEFFIDRNKDGLPDRDKDGNLPTHSWFVTFAPAEKPQIAMVVFIFEGGEGSQVAVPVAHDILEYFFSRDLQETAP